MTGRLKTTEQRANEAVQKYVDWFSRNNDAPTEKRRQILRDLIYEAIANAEAALSKRLQAKRPQPKAFLSFPFLNHRTLAEVMDTGDAA